MRVRRMHQHVFGRHVALRADHPPHQGHVLPVEHAHVHGQQGRLGALRVFKDHRLGMKGVVHAPGQVVVAEVAHQGQPGLGREVDRSHADADPSHSVAPS